MARKLKVFEPGYTQHCLKSVHDYTYTYKQYRKYSAVNKVKFSKSFLLIKFLLTFYTDKKQKKWNQNVPGKLGECIFSHENLKSFWGPKAGPRPHAFITSLCLCDCLTISINSELQQLGHTCMYTICTHTYKESFFPIRRTFVSRKISI